VLVSVLVLEYTNTVMVKIYRSWAKVWTKVFCKAAQIIPSYSP
jgi:hypothetical protein